MQSWLRPMTRPQCSLLVLVHGTPSLVEGPRWGSRMKCMGCQIPSYPLLNTVYHIPYMVYDRKMMIGYYWLSKFSLKEFFFSQPQKEFSIWSLRVKIFLNRPQKLKKLGFESFKNTPLKIRMPRHVRIQGNYNLQIPIVVTSSLLALANFREFLVRKKRILGVF